MKLNTTAGKPGAEGVAVARIVVGTEVIEYHDQPFIIAEDDAAPKKKKDKVRHTTDSSFLMANLRDAWGVLVQVPISSEMPGRIGGESFTDTVPDINWTTTPPEISAYAGPTIGITVGQAILALTAYADQLRATVAPPSE